MSKHNKMICPACGHAMNYHAQKLVYASPSEPGYDPSLGGALEESYTCPACGTAASRRQS